MITITNKGATHFTAEMWGAFVDLKPGVPTEIKNPFRGGKLPAKPESILDHDAAQRAAASDETFALALLQAYPHRDLVLERESDGASVSMAVPTKLGNIAGGVPQIGELPEIAPPSPPAPLDPAEVTTGPAAKPASKPKGKGK